MTTPKISQQHEQPTSGGSYVRDPKTGKLKRTEGTEPAEAFAPEPTEHTVAPDAQQQEG